jgi:UDP-GlcNAc3NAcA epimerase
MTGRMLIAIEEKILETKPDTVLVYGDTNSTLAGALTASKLHVPVVHVEAGLRSFNMKMPEEINRIVTDRLSDVLFCPTTTAMSNLEREGFGNFNSEIILSGDVMEDAVHYYSQTAADTSKILHQLALTPNGFILATLHRAENTNEPSRLASIVEGLNDIHKLLSHVVLPIHPRTRQIIEKLGIETNFTMIDPVGYFDMLHLINHAAMVCTDSGGLQKEAFFCSKYCVTLRDETEWVELVDGGYNFLVGSDKKLLFSTVTNLIDTAYPTKQNLYGGGNAGQIICKKMEAVNSMEVNEAIG